MRTLRVVVIHPAVNIRLQFFQSLIHLFAKGNLIKLIEDGFVEAFADTVGLRRFDLCFRMVNVFDRQVKLVFVMLPIAAVFRAAISQDSQEPNFFGFNLQVI